MNGTYSLERRVRERRLAHRGGRRSSDAASADRVFDIENAPLILVVDDYEDGRELTVMYLRGQGFRVMEAATGREAIEAAAVVQPDLILLDFVLPDLTGLQVASQLRASPATDRIKIALHTASVTGSVRQQAREHGVDLFLPRPCDLSVLAEQLACVLKARGPGTIATIA